MHYNSHTLFVSEINIIPTCILKIILSLLILGSAGRPLTYDLGCIITDVDILYK